MAPGPCTATSPRRPARCAPQQHSSDAGLAWLAPPAAQCRTSAAAALALPGLPCSAALGSCRAPLVLALVCHWGGSLVPLGAAGPVHQAPATLIHPINPPLAVHPPPPPSHPCHPNYSAVHLGRLPQRQVQRAGGHRRRSSWPGHHRGGARGAGGCRLGVGGCRVGAEAPDTTHRSAP